MTQNPTGPAPFKPLPRELVGLAGLIAIIEIALSLADRGLLFSPYLRAQLFETGAFWTQLLRGAEPIFGAQPYTMFVSHALLHGSFLHMAMNTAILLAMGRFASDLYGPRCILPVFVIGAVCGGIAFGILSAEPFPMVGASGAVFTFLGLWIVWDWRRHRAAGASVGPVMTRVAVLAGMNVVLWLGLSGMVAWEAHLGGFLVGLAAGRWLENRNAARARAIRAAARRRLHAASEETR